jgi:hypothetical protein
MVVVPKTKAEARFRSQVFSHMCAAYMRQNCELYTEW